MVWILGGVLSGVLFTVLRRRHRSSAGLSVEGARRWESQGGF